jgi:hypothetical protein
VDIVLRAHYSETVADLHHCEKVADRAEQRLCVGGTLLLFLQLLRLPLKLSAARLELL